MGGIRELMDGKIWEWDLSFRLEWDGNGNEVIEMLGNWYEKSVPAHLYIEVRPLHRSAEFLSGGRRTGPEIKMLRNGVTNA